MAVGGVGASPLVLLLMQSIARWYTISLSTVVLNSRDCLRNLLFITGRCDLGDQLLCTSHKALLPPVL